MHGAGWKGQSAVAGSKQGRPFMWRQANQGPRGGLLLIFMFSKDHALLWKLPSSLGVSMSPEFRPAGTGRLLLVLFSSYRIKTLVMLSPSDHLHFAVLCLECQEQAVSNSSWGLGAVWGSGSLLFVSLCSLCFFFHFTPRSLGKDAPAWLPSPGLSTTELAQLNFSHTHRTEHRGEVRSWVLQTRVLVSALLFSCCAS